MSSTNTVLEHPVDVLRIPIRGYEKAISTARGCSKSVTNPYKGLWDAIDKNKWGKLQELRIPIRGYEAADALEATGLSDVTNPYKGLWAPIKAL